MLAVVLAAGRGTRLGPLTTHRSKAMLPVVGQPMIEHVLDMLWHGGADRFVVVAHPADHELSSHLIRSSHAARIDVVCQNRRLGMAHALECAAPLIWEMEVPAFLLAACDNLYPEGHVANLIAHYRKEDPDAALTLTWTSPERATASAVTIVQGSQITDIVEKPTLEEIARYSQGEQALCVPPLYALSSSVLDYLDQVPLSPRGEREFADAVRLLIANGGTVVGQLVERRITLTKAEDLLALNRHVMRKNPEFATVHARLPRDVTIVPPVHIEEGVSVASGCRIGPDTYLESGCRIGAGAVVRRSVVLRGGAVGERSRITDSVVIRSQQTF